MRLISNSMSLKKENLLESPTYQGRPFADARAERLFHQAFDSHLGGMMDEAIQMYRSSLSIEMNARALTYLAWALSSRFEYEQSIRLCQQAIAIDAQYANPYNDIGAYLIELGREEEALIWLEKALEMKHYECPFYAHYNLGRVYKRKGQMKFASACFARALRLKPDFPAASREHQELGRLLN